MIQAYIGKEIHTRRNNFLFHVCRGCLTSVHNLPSFDERCSMSNFLGVNHVLPPPTHRLYCRRISSSDFKTIHSSTKNHVVRLALHLNSISGGYTISHSCGFSRNSTNLIKKQTSQTKSKAISLKLHSRMAIAIKIISIICSPARLLHQYRTLKPYM